MRHCGTIPKSPIKNLNNGDKDNEENNELHQEQVVA
jgi:hypothetical protein